MQHTIAASSVFDWFLVIGGIWTLIWVYIFLRSAEPKPYSRIYEEIQVLRRVLVALVIAGAAVLFVVSLRWLPYAFARARNLGPPRVSVRALGVQWAWGLSQNTVPAGVPVEFLVTSGDVNHDFAIYAPDGELVAQVQAMPGYTNRLIYEFSRPGTYTVRCLEYCGLAHHVMTTTLTVQPS